MTLYMVEMRLLFYSPQDQEEEDKKERHLMTVVDAESEDEAMNLVNRFNQSMPPQEKKRIRGLEVLNAAPLDRSAFFYIPS